MPSELATEKDTIFAHLRSKHHGVSVSKSWISDHLRNGNSNVEQLYKKWLITDLTDTNAESLPPEATNMEIQNYKLTGPFTLQLISVLDVGSSFYSQLKKLDGKSVPQSTQSTQNSTQVNEPPPSRMLFLTLTDGTNIISAMEYKPCTQLSVNLLPGSKIVVCNLTVRIGMLLLEPGNFRVLGGCVESLRVIYSQKQVLKCALNDGDDDEDEDEKNDNQDSSRVAATNQNAPTGQNAASSQSGQSGPSGHSAPRDQTAPGIQSAPSSLSATSNQSALSANFKNDNPIVNCAQVNMKTDNKDCFAPNNLHQQNLEPQNITSFFKNANSNHNYSEQTKTIPYRPKDTLACNQITKISSPQCVLTKGTSNKPTQKHEVTRPKTTVLRANKKLKSVEPSFVPPSEVTMEKEPPLSGFLDSLTAEFFEPINESVVSTDLSIPVKSLCPSLTFPVKVTAAISSLCSKLTPSPEWTVQASLTDFSGSKECRLSESMLSAMIGYTSQEFNQLKPVSATNPSIKIYLRQGLESCQKELTFLTGIFTVQPNTVTQVACPFEVVACEKMEISQEKGLRDFVMAKCNNV